MPTKLIDRSFRERIVLVALVAGAASLTNAEASLDELGRLVDTAGADEAGRVVQRRERPDPATYIGQGKARELHELCESVDADTVVFDDELSPAQQRNLEAILGRTAIDRTAVILDIFAQNAQTEEGRAQVELALLQYRLPRLRGRGKTLSQQAGGIGTRGPGETQLEVDRRRLMRRMTKLETELVRLSSTRRTQRKARGRSRLKTISLVGYTNAGKSTLRNALTGAGVLVADRLFATLDPRTRRLLLPNGDTALCSDTVGFIRKLPHQLVESFRSTLEVVGESDLLVHVVDATAAEPFAQMDAVRSVLKEIGAGEVAELVVFNKADCTPEAARLAASVPGSVAISASTGEGIGELLASVADRLRTNDLVVELVVPFDRGDVLAALHREGEILAQDQIEAGIRLHVVLARDGVQRYAQFVPDRQTS